MPIKIGGKVYRNLQEQVQKNMEDIDEIKKAMPIPYNEYYNKNEIDSKVQYIHRICLYYYDDEAEEPDYYNVYFDYFSNKADEYTLEEFKREMQAYTYSNSYNQYNGFRFELTNHHDEEINQTISKELHIYFNDQNELVVEVNCMEWVLRGDFTWEENTHTFYPSHIRDYLNG